MFYQIFLSPQVKRWAIVTYKYGIYELPHELPNDLRLRILDHVYMRPEVNSNRLEISNRFEKLFRLHGDFTAATCK